MNEVFQQVIHQTLHGYSDGHSLIASSVDLGSAEKKHLLIMSDLSGSGVDLNYSNYITGYPIPNSQYYALAKTWHAPEMSRPGCVWTHTLLIDITLLSHLKNLERLHQYFKRPQIGEYTEYKSSHIINLNKSEPLLDESYFKGERLFRLLTLNLYQYPDKKLVIPAESTGEIEPYIYKIWDLQWPRLRRNFTFCTGALSLREINGEILDIQLVPSHKQSSILRKQSDDVLLINPNVTTKHEWLDYFLGPSIDDFLGFMYKFGADIDGKRRNFIPLVLAYHFMENKVFRPEDFIDIFQTLEEVFPDKNEGKAIKNSIFNKLVQSKHSLLYETMTLLLNNIELRTRLFAKYKTEYLFEVISSNNDSSKEILHLILLSKDYLSKEQLVDILKNIPIEFWINASWIEYQIIESVLSLQPQFSQFDVLWNTENEAQIFRFLTHSERNLDWEALIFSMLHAGIGQYAKDCLELLGTDALFIALDFINKNKKALPREWVDEVANNRNIFFQWISLQTNLADDAIFHTMNVNPNSKANSSVKADTWFIIIENIKKKKLENSFEIATYILVASLLNNLQQSEKIVTTLFPYYHQLVLKERITIKLWNYFDYYLKDKFKNIYYIESFNWFYPVREHYVDITDHAEILRRYFLNAFIKYKWAASNLVECLEDIDTFHKVVKYSKKFEAGSNLFLYAMKKHSNKLNDIQIDIIKYELKLR